MTKLLYDAICRLTGKDVYGNWLLLEQCTQDTAGGNVAEFTIAFAAVFLLGNVPVSMKVTVFSPVNKALLGTTRVLVAFLLACKGLRVTTPGLIAF